MKSMRSAMIDGTDDYQAAILDALPAQIALLDADGTITSVNRAWRLFGDANGLLSPGHEVGINYLAVCEGARGDGALLAHEAAAGIRSVLDGTAINFSLEYPCHSPIEKRWFVMTVTPLVDGQCHGVVVTHVNVTAERLAEANLRASESRFRQMAETINDVFFLREAATNRVLYISPAYEEVWGRSRESLYADSESWAEAIHPAYKAWIEEQHRAYRATGLLGTLFAIGTLCTDSRW